VGLVVIDVELSTSVFFVFRFFLVRNYKVYLDFSILMGFGDIFISFEALFHPKVDVTIFLFSERIKKSLRIYF